MDAFGLALEREAREKAEEARIQSNASPPYHPPPSTTKEPTEVMLYGYSPSTMWAAISFYEKVSLGMICEDYQRDPPVERRRFPNQFGAACHVPPRPLTENERVLARQYRGGECWIKVTFDSAKAADRAISSSPHMLQGHRVYAELFTGAGPEVDEPIPWREGDQGQGQLDAPRRAHRGVKPLPAATMTAEEARPEAAPSSLSSSATTTPPAFGYSKPRKQPLRAPPANDSTGSGGQAARPVRDPRFFTHFPTVPRTILRPAHEAFLPAQPSWAEASIARLVAAGWLPGDMIGGSVPRLENGDFDWAGASLYWKAFYWIDTHFGTDFCGMKGED